MSDLCTLGALRLVACLLMCVRSRASQCVTVVCMDGIRPACCSRSAGRVKRSDARYEAESCCSQPVRRCSLVADLLPSGQMNKKAVKSGKQVVRRCKHLAATARTVTEARALTSPLSAMTMQWSVHFGLYAQKSSWPSDHDMA